MSFQIYKSYYAEECNGLFFLMQTFSIAGGETAFSLKSNVVKKKIKH